MMLSDDSVKQRDDLLHHSARHSDGNLVDGLPRALHTEALGAPHGGLGPAPICKLDSEN